MSRCWAWDHVKKAAFRFSLNLEVLDQKPFLADSCFVQHVRRLRNASPRGFEASCGRIDAGNGSVERGPELRQNYFEHPEQYPPISNRETTIRNRQSFSTCPFSFSKISLTNSIILPQRRQAMWMWSRFSLRS